MNDTISQSEEVAEHNNQYQAQRDSSQERAAGIDLDASYEDANKKKLDTMTNDNRDPEGENQPLHDVRENPVPGELHTKLFVNNETVATNEDPQLRELKKETYELLDKVRLFFDQHDRFMASVLDQDVKNYLQQKNINVDKFTLFYSQGINTIIDDFDSFAKQLEKGKTMSEMKTVLKVNQSKLEQSLKEISVQLNNLQTGEMTFLQYELARTKNDLKAEGLEEWQFTDLEKKVGNVDYELRTLQTDFDDIKKRYEGIESAMKTG